MSVSFREGSIRPGLYTRPGYSCGVAAACARRHGRGQVLHSDIFPARGEMDARHENVGM